MKSAAHTDYVRGTHFSVRETHTPRPMRPSEELYVRALFARCHPTWPPPPPGWWFAHPTLVIETATAIIGSTSWTISLAPTGDVTDRPVMYGKDVCVDPAYRGRGLGLVLHQARLAWAERMGCCLFFGMTWADNRAMRAIFAACGHEQAAVIPRAYPDNEPPSDGLLYVARLGGE